MELLSGLIQVISIDFDLNNNTPVDARKNEETSNNTGQKSINEMVIQLLDSFKEWKSGIEFLESQCALHDYKNIKANGYRTMFKINILAIKRVNKKLSGKNLNIKHLIQCLALSKLMSKINNKIKDNFEKDEELKRNWSFNNNSESDQTLKSNDTKLFFSNNLFSVQQSIDFFEFYSDLEQDLATYFQYHAFFHYRKDLGKSAKALMTFCSVSSNLPCSLILNAKQRSEVLAKMLRSPTISFPFSIISQNDCRAYNDVFIPLKFFNDGLSTNTIYLPRQYRFRMNDLNTCINTNEFLTIDNNWTYDSFKNSKQPKNDEMIRVRIIKEKLTPKNKTIMFHVHGGAFVFHSPECHEIYLREFAKKLPEIVIISVAYRVRAKYPKAQQDILDAYLWLSSGLNEVEKAIGFKPEKIVLCGDSAGAFFNFTLMHLLINFNSKIKDENLSDQKLKYPDAVFNFYGYYNLTTSSAAIFSSYLDFFLPPSSIKIAFGSLIWGVEKPKFKKRIFLPWFADKKKRWYNSRDTKELTMEMIKIFNSIPYLNSIYYFNYDAMKIPLYLVTTDIDLCLDHNIDLANRWKGDVSLSVLGGNLIHGFLQLEGGASTIRQDIIESCNLLRTAFNKL